MEDYLETHFEVVVELMYQLEIQENPGLLLLYEQRGRGGLWELAKDITDEFESLNKNREWKDGEWFDKIYEFISNKLDKL